MIRIAKSKEPEDWTARKNTPGVTKYKHATIPALKEALLKEQGYICAYCMRRIPIKDNGNNEQYEIDHVFSQLNHPELQFEYGNMAICCPGFINGIEHCDKSKHDNDLNIPIFSPLAQASISYSTKNGEIKSDNQVWDLDMNNILCLNNISLKNNRSQTLDGVRTILEKKKWSKAEMQNKLEEWSNFDALGRLKPYCGIVIWYLQKKIRQMN